MYIWVFQIGPPIDSFTRQSRSSSPLTSHTEDQMVVSVGPYTFHTSPTRSTMLPDSSLGSASPPHNPLRSGPPSHPASSSIRHVAGVACITVAPDFLISSPSTIGS